MGFSLKKIGKAIGGAAKSVGGAVYGGVKQLDVTDKRALAGKVASNPIGQVVLAPIVAPTAIAIKATTAVGAATGLKPLRQLDQRVGEAYRGTVVRGLRDNFKTQLEIGAAVGGAIGGGKAAQAAAKVVPAIAGDPAANVAPTAGPVAGDPRATSSPAGPVAVAGDPRATAVPSHELNEPVRLWPGSSPVGPASSSGRSIFAELWAELVALFTPKP